ncbi:hypothetical protein [Streptomyces scabiei]|uniref:hypothetical protein n=1 Tax=Streptomyces scabiei TaxID=1930 RepID=UPI000AE22B5F|nr:hypothetical protein [Streptomyces scabiei]
MSTDQRAAEPGELCTCGRQAVLVFSTEEFGDVGYCGVEGSAFDPVLPCPWCGSSAPHTQSWGDPKRCPDYQLRPPEQPAVAEGGNGGSSSSN